VVRRASLVGIWSRIATMVKTEMRQVPHCRDGKPPVDRTFWQPRGIIRKAGIIVGKACVRTRRNTPPRHYIYDNKYT
jgi:hypothetical protein